MRPIHATRSSLGQLVPLAFFLWASFHAIPASAAPTEKLVERLRRLANNSALPEQPW